MLDTTTFDQSGALACWFMDQRSDEHFTRLPEETKPPAGLPERWIELIAGDHQTMASIGEVRYRQERDERGHRLVSGVLIAVADTKTKSLIMRQLVIAGELAGTPAWVRDCEEQHYKEVWDSGVDFFANTPAAI